MSDTLMVYNPQIEWLNDVASDAECARQSVEDRRRADEIA